MKSRTTRNITMKRRRMSQRVQNQMMRNNHLKLMKRSPQLNYLKRGRMTVLRLFLRKVNQLKKKSHQIMGLTTMMSRAGIFGELRAQIGSSMIKRIKMLTSKV